MSKPDNQTPLTALWALELARARPGCPRTLLQVVLGPGRSSATPLIDGADYVGFTGSTATGRTVAEQAGRRLIGCSLELGGKNAMLVLDDADVDEGRRGRRSGRCFSNGRPAVRLDRADVRRTTASTTSSLAEFVERVDAMRLGAGLDYGADMGSLTSARQLETVTAHVEDAGAKGATVLAGGRPRPDLGPYFYEPTVLERRHRRRWTLLPRRDVRPGRPVYRVRATTTRRSSRANDIRYGLNASVWTRDADARPARSPRGCGPAPSTSTRATPRRGAAIDAPMGGMRRLGLGRRHGAEGILKYTEVQTIAVQRLLPIAPLPGHVRADLGQDHDRRALGDAPPRAEIGDLITG